MAYDDKKAERIRRWIVNLVFIVYWLLIFEGALRKWAFPQYHRYIFFIRDPFVMLIYWLAFKNRLYPKNMSLFLYGFSLSIVFLFFVLFQSIITTSGLMTLVYGWRMYFFYLPLAFIVGQNFDGNDLKRLLRQTLYVAVPMGLLVYAQHISPPASFINQTAESSVIYTIAGARGGSIVRPTGTFTFFHGQQLFIGSVMAFIFSSWILPKEYRPINTAILSMASVSAVVNLALSGTRLPYIFSGLICMSAGACAVVIRRPKISARALAIPIVLFILGAFAFVYFFAGVGQMTLERHRGAEDIEGSVFQRFGNMLFMFTGFVQEVDMFGMGIGSHTSGGAALTTGYREDSGVEDEWTRILFETGLIFGPIYIFLRVLLVFWIIRSSIRATNRSDNPLPVLLVAYISSVLLVWAITNYGTEMGYGWLFLGFSIAANKLGIKERGIWG